MSIITLDFETFYRSGKNKGSVGPKYSLSDLTYEEYLRNEEYETHGVGIKVDTGKTTYYPKTRVKEILESIFTRGNEHILIGHNVAFDGAILSWIFGLRAAKYYCTQNMSQALWAQGSASLEALAKRLWPDDKTKRKGKELISFDGIKNLSPDQQLIMGGYCCNDVDLTFDAFAIMYPFFPNSELDIIDLTLQMFIHPLFLVNRPLIEEYQSKLLLRREELIKNCGVAESVLASNKQFAEYLLTTHNITVPLKPSPTKKNPNNTSLALAKDDVEFIELQATHPTLKPLWNARIAITSSGELSRCERILKHSETSHINPLGCIAVPLKYCGAHTKRFSGTNKVNFQNFKRKSPLRYALTAPADHVVIVRDLANIEGRMNAWFNGQEDKLEAFRRGDDIYNLVAADIYKRPIDRKRKLQDANGNYLNAKGEITTEDNAFEPDELEGRVGKVAELGLGYQMGSAKFLLQLFLAGVNCDFGFADMVVKTWRYKNDKIVKGWAMAERVIFDMARKDLIPYQWGCITVEQGRLKLPNGLYMTYPGLTYVENEEKRGFEYWAGRYMKSLYGGLLMENCLAGDTEILTDSGWKLLKNISIADKVHDGIEFVPHEGLIEKGMQTCIEIDGVYMTPDHEVLDEEQRWVPASQHPKPYRPDIGILNSNHIRSQPKEKQPLELFMCMWEHLHTSWNRIKKGRNTGVFTKLWVPNPDKKTHPQLFAPQNIPPVVEYARTLQNENESGMEKLRSPWDRCRPRVGCLRTILGRYGGYLATWFGFGAPRQICKLFRRELLLGSQQTTRMEPRDIAACRPRPNSRTKRRETIDPILPASPQPVFDIRNAGPRHRFVVKGNSGPFIVHNCIQAISRVVMTDMMREINKEIKQYAARIVLTVHDEIVVIAPKIHTEAVMQSMKRIMSTPPDWCNDGRLVLSSSGGYAENYSK